MADDGKVGFRRPPKSRQFGQPGGNSRGPGRAKGAKNLATIFAETVGATIIVKDGSGKTRKISKLEASMIQLVNQAASGNQRAINMLLVLAQALEARAHLENKPEVVLTDADRKLIAMMTERVKAQSGGDDE